MSNSAFDEISLNERSKDSFDVKLISFYVFFIPGMVFIPDEGWYQNFTCALADPWCIKRFKAGFACYIFIYHKIRQKHPNIKTKSTLVSEPILL